MDDDSENLPTLADFFFHAGDKASYNSSLEGLFVCYTLTRGLQLEGTNPRRLALPLELILRITRFAGYMDANPDPSLTLSIDQPEDPPSPYKRYHSPPLSRKHITFMARIHIIRQNHSKLPSPYPLYSFEPFGECQLFSKIKPFAILLPGNDWYIGTLGNSERPLNIPNHFTPDYMHQIFGQGKTPVRVGCPEPAQVLFWRWWEPKF